MTLKLVKNYKVGLSNNHIPIPELSQLDISRFWDKVYVSDKEVCWNWKANTIKGYGMFCVSGFKIRAHRIAYYLGTKADPLDMVVCHSCDNPSCCNPNHLFAGTQLDNIRDRVLKGRTKSQAGLKNGAYTCPDKVNKGSKNGFSKLTETEVIEILRLRNSGAKNKDLAIKFNVTPENISSIVVRKAWKHIELDFDYTNPKVQGVKTKLTNENILEIRERYSKGNVTTVSLGEDYGVSRSHISCIVNNKRWTHI